MQIIDVPSDARISFAKPTGDQPVAAQGDHFVVMDVATYDDMVGRLVLAEALISA